MCCLARVSHSGALRSWKHLSTKGKMERWILSGLHIVVALQVRGLLVTASKLADVRRTVPPRAPPLHFSRNGTFKIMQVADLHYSVSPGHCLDTDLSPCRKGDYQTESLLSRALDSEKPDLVIFTGDQVSPTSSSI